MVVGCAPKEQPEAVNEAGSEAETANEKLKIENLEFASGSASGSWIKIAAAISEKANDYFEGFPITATPGGSVGNPSVVFTGNSDIGMSYGPFLVMAESGTGPYEQPINNLKAVASLTPTVLHFFGDSELKADTIQELFANEQVVLGLPPKGSGSSYIAEIIFSKLGYDSLDGIEKDGSKIFYGDAGTLVDAWKDRHVDANILTMNLPGASIQESLTARDGKLINIDDELIDALVKENGFDRFTIPAGTYVGQDEDIETIALKIVIFVQEDVPEDVVYNLTKAIYENKTYFESVHSSFADFYPEEMADGVVIDLHEGAKKFYKEAGMIGN
jgi:hypothetical protein